MSFAGFFVDEDTLALAGLPDVVHPGHPRLADIPRETADRVWIPIVARLGLILVTRDKRIRREPAERSAFENAGVRGFVITTRNMRSNDLRGLFIVHAPAMRAMATDQPRGPWLYAVTRTRIGPQVVPTPG